MNAPWYVEALGLMAGTLTTASFAPQVVKAWRSRQTRDISLIMYVALTVGVASWLVYGLFIDSTPIVAANAVTLVLVLAVVILKLRHG